MAKLRQYLQGTTEDDGMMPGQEPDYPTDYPPPPQGGPIQDFPTPQGPLGPAPTGAAPAFDLDAWYKSQPDFGGRGPDDNERASDMENIAKYGEAAFKSDFAKRNKPQALPGGGAMGDVNYLGGQGGGNSGGFGSIMDELKKLFPNGAFNQDIVNRRVDNVRDQLNRFSNSRNASNRAQLASRGLIGSGPEITAINRNEENIGNQYANALSGIYADESANADARMMQALQLATGMTSDQARVELERELGLKNLDLGWGRLGLDKTLGLGNLALGNMNGTNDYNLGLARLGLDRDRLQHEIENGNIDQIIQIITQLLAGANTSAGGYY